MPQSSSARVPQLRSTAQDDTRRTTWAELLNDLVFTVIIAQLAQRLLKSPDTPSLFGFLLLYVPVWWLWNGETHYSTRFDNDRDVLHRFLASFQLLGLIVLAAAVPNALETNQAAVVYALTYSAVRIILLVEYGRAWYYIPDARPYIKLLITGFAVSVLIWGISALVPVPYRFILWGLALLIELGTPLSASSKRLHEELPPDVRHLPERYGLFTLLVLGQSVTSTAHSLIQKGFETNTILATLLGGVVIIGLWWAYFDRLDDDAVRQVKQGGSSHLYTLWLYLHLPLTVALTVIGVGLTLAIQSIDADELHPSTKWLLLGSLSGYFMTEAGISLTTLRAGPSHVGFIQGISVRFGLAVLLIIIGLTIQLSTLALLAITAGLIVGLIISDYFAPDPPESAERISLEKDDQPTEKPMSPL
ncbi:low temperature requirement protein A [Spirosoma soli]|uniref:Low temperature requirement protein A n=1 Tax=Spirosoma soli TaxID=1770529 RepID=A0ABW5M1A2_9BACT